MFSKMFGVKIHKEKHVMQSFFFFRTPVAIGTAAVSSAEMHSQGMKGKGVCVLHTYMDTLWWVGFIVFYL